MIFASAALSRISPRTHVPVAALIVAGAFPSLIACAGLFLVDAIKTIVAFGSAGIYIAFQMIVAAALYARARGWKPAGAFRLGAWAWPVNVGALIFGTGAAINILWPRSPDQPWYDNYGLILCTAAIAGGGLAYMLISKAYDRGNAPAGDAYRLHRKTR